MATIGLSRPYYAKYANTNGVTSYSGGGVVGGAVEFSASIDSGESNDLYADNAIAETDRSFGGGTLSITTDDLTQESSTAILGIATQEINVGDDTVTELLYDDDMQSPDLGFGIIIKKKKNKQDLFRAVIFTKIQFSIPEDAATTQGESIEWQTPTLEAVIMRDDTAKRCWKREATFSDEAKARAYIEQVLNITGGTT